MTDIFDRSLLLSLHNGTLRGVISRASDPQAPRVVEAVVPQAPTSAPLIDAAAALQAAVYDTPELLEEYREVALIYRSPFYSVIPSAARDHAGMLLRSEFPGEELEPVVCPTCTDNALVVAGMSRELGRFFRRTFPGIKVTHHLALLASYFASGERPGGNGVRVYANFTKAGVDIVALDRARLLAAVTRPARTAPDAAYFVMAAMQSLGLDMMDTEVTVGGDTAMRNELMAFLRTYVAQVMPLILVGPLASADIPLELKVYYRTRH